MRTAAGAPGDWMGPAGWLAQGISGLYLPPLLAPFTSEVTRRVCVRARKVRFAPANENNNKKNAPARNRMRSKAKKSRH